MKNIAFAQAQFIKSALSLESLPDLRNSGGLALPEIAIAGKSNVGKSSLINQLLRRKNLARVSATPGKTQTLNFFTVDDAVAIVDLPGYGYAKVSKDTRLQWSKNIETYFLNRSALRLLLLLIDMRRGLTEDDLAVAEWATYYKKPLLLVFTKMDKAGEKEKQIQTRAALQTLGDAVPYVYFSIKEPFARKALITNINNLL